MVNKRYIVIFTTTCFLLLALLTYNPKHNIYNATTTQLNSVQGIGNSLSTQIYVYVQKYHIQNARELEGHIKYLGKERLSKLEEVYK